MEPPKEGRPEENQFKVDTGYHSFLIRIWRDAPEKDWHASAQPVTGGPAVRFNSLEALFAYVSEQTGHGRDEGKDDA